MTSVSRLPTRHAREALPFRDSQAPVREACTQLRRALALTESDTNEKDTSDCRDPRRLSGLQCDQG